MSQDEDSQEINIKEPSVERGLLLLQDIVAALVYSLEVSRGSHHSEDATATNFYEEVRNFEISLIKAALKQTRGNQAKAARLLKLTDHAARKNQAVQALSGHVDLRRGD
jgi:transcriptional regulator with GAF, ATPase, and Fis domain